jgi:hypothetical protein
MLIWSGPFSIRITHRLLIHRRTLIMHTPDRCATRTRKESSTMNRTVAQTRVNTSLMSLAIGAAMLAPAATLHAARPCPPDINCSGAVDVSDLITVITSWGNTSGPADVNGSGLVDVADLLQVITNWGACLVNYGPA